MRIARSKNRVEVTLEDGDRVVDFINSQQFICDSVGHDWTISLSGSKIILAAPPKLVTMERYPG